MENEIKIHMNEIVTMFSNRKHADMAIKALKWEVYKSGSLKPRIVVLIDDEIPFLTISFLDEFIYQLNIDGWLENTSFSTNDKRVIDMLQKISTNSKLSLRVIYNSKDIIIEPEKATASKEPEVIFEDL